jgi:hypothetical protein
LIDFCGGVGQVGSVRHVLDPAGTGCSWVFRIANGDPADPFRGVRYVLRFLFLSIIANRSLAQTNGGEHPLCAGFIVNVSLGVLLRWFNVKALVVTGLLVGIIAVVPLGIISPSSNFWAVRHYSSSLVSPLELPLTALRFGIVDLRERVTWRFRLFSGIQHTHDRSRRGGT